MYFGVQSFSFGRGFPKLKLWTPKSPIIHGSVLSNLKILFLKEIGFFGILDFHDFEVQL